MMKLVQSKGLIIFLSLLITFQPNLGVRVTANDTVEIALPSGTVSNSGDGLPQGNGIQAAYNVGGTGENSAPLPLQKVESNPGYTTQLASTFDSKDVRLDMPSEQDLALWNEPDFLMLAESAGYVSNSGLPSSTLGIALIPNTLLDDGSYDHSAVSANGRYVAFESSNVLLKDESYNNRMDIYLYDGSKGETLKISSAMNGGQADGSSRMPAITPDGRYVAFESNASNLVEGDFNDASDIFVYDRLTGNIELVSRALDGTPGNRASHSPSLSADGRFVAFESDAFDLVSGDANKTTDIFVYDRDNFTTKQVSLSSENLQGNKPSRSPSISGDGRFVTFESSADNLVPGDTNGGPGWMADIFVRDLQSDQTERVSVSSGGLEANNASSFPVISGNGRFIAFWSSANNLVESDTNEKVDVFLYDRETHTCKRITMGYDGSQANGQSWYKVAISLNGQYVTFGSSATNLVAGDNNTATDIFVYDQQTAEISRVSLGYDGSQGNRGSDLPSISSDGRFVSYASQASNIVKGSLTQRGIYLFDSGASASAYTISGQVTDSTGIPLAGITVSTSAGQSTVTDQDGYYTVNSLGVGSYVITPDVSDLEFSPASRLVNLGANLTQQDFVAQTENTALIADSTQYGYPLSSLPAMSLDGRYLAFAAKSNRVVAEALSDYMDVFIQDQNTGNIVKISVAPDGSQANGNSFYPAISADGRFVAFVSEANNLVAGDNNNFADIFVHDRKTGDTRRVSIASDTREANGHSSYPSISANGRFVSFASAANNLVVGDTNSVLDIFVHDMLTGLTERVSLASDDQQADLGSTVSALSADGRYVTFASAAKNLAQYDTNGLWDIFLRDRMTGKTQRVSISSIGSQGNADACLEFSCLSISADGQLIAFESSASNLVQGDTNQVSDVFVHDINTHKTVRVSMGLGGEQSSQRSNGAAMSANGRYVFFLSSAGAQVGGDPANRRNLFMHDRRTGQTKRLSIQLEI